LLLLTIKWNRFRVFTGSSRVPHSSHLSEDCSCLQTFRSARGSCSRPGSAELVIPSGVVTATFIHCHFKW
jgi:hypothetical protein